MKAPGQPQNESGLGFGGGQGSDNTRGFEVLLLYKPIKWVVSIVYDGGHGANSDMWGAFNDESRMPFI